MSLLTTLRRNMSLAVCQLPGNSLLKTCTAKVVSCVPIPAAAPAGKGGKKKAADVDAGLVESPKFNIVLSETVLFPEGGGQPFDTGYIEATDGSSTRVLNTQRDPSNTNNILHQSTNELPEGANVTVTVDWDRRFDLMQQHTAQHLISAVFRRDFSAPTLSWSMAKQPEPSYIDIDLDLNAGTFSDYSFRSAERTINAMIRDGVATKVHVFPSAAAALEAPVYKAAVAAGQAKAFPAGLVGPARCVEIEGLEFNTCCGTHTPSLSMLQAVALLRYEKVKNTTRLWFLAGDRAISQLSTLYEQQSLLTRVLQAPPEDHAHVCTRMYATMKQRADEIDALRARIAESQLATVLASKDFIVYINEPLEACADTKSLSLLQALMSQTPRVGGKIVVATAVSIVAEDPADIGKHGVFLVCGDDATRVKEIGTAVAGILEGRGGGRPGVFQGKATRVDKANLLPAMISNLAL